MTIPIRKRKLRRVVFSGVVRHFNCSEPAVARDVWKRAMRPRRTLVRGVSGCPATSFFQSGWPRSGRPAITIVRRYWLLTSDKVGRIDDQNRLPSSLAVGAVTRLAVRRVHLRAPIRIASSGTGIGRGARTRSGSACPSFADAGNQDVDLTISQRTAGALRERRHRGTRNSAGDHAAHRSVVDDREIYRIVHRDRGAGLAVGSVASRAILAVQCCEVSHVGRTQRKIGLGGTAGK